MQFENKIRKRIQNMVIYFVDHTQNVNQLKLDKLFFFADKASCQERGLSISEQTYVARERGPVPVSPDKKESIFYIYKLGDVIIPDELGFYSRAPDAIFDESLFTPEQLGYLERTSKEFCHSSGDDLSKLSHDPDDVWYEVWDNGNGNEKEINLLADEKLPQKLVKRRELLRRRQTMAREAFAKLGI